MISVSNWFFWALLSAVFAALTAIFAKVGLEGVDSDLATLVRTFVIMAVLNCICARHQKMEQSLRAPVKNMALPRAFRIGDRRILGMLLPSPEDR